jgi:AraC-like DNA-binding protein
MQRSTTTTVRAGSVRQPLFSGTYLAADTRSGVRNASASVTHGASVTSASFPVAAGMSPAPAVITLCTPHERQRVDALARGEYEPVHRDTVEQVLHDLRHRPASAVVLSVSRYSPQQATGTARLVREFPGVAAVALLTANEARASSALLALGGHGVRTVVDAREPTGWRTLRDLITSDHAGQIEPLAVRTLREDLAGARTAALRFLDLLFTVPVTLTTVRELSRQMGVMPTTLMSRFFRAQLPPPKRYLAFARLVRAARLLENPGYSITQVAFLMEYSSPQSFSRHVTAQLRVSAAQFRRRFTGVSMLQHMREVLIHPYREQWMRFDPFASTPQWLSALGRHEGHAVSPETAEASAHDAQVRVSG